MRTAGLLERRPSDRPTYTPWHFQARLRGLAGLGPYGTAPVSWFKILNPAYTQKRGRREMFDKFRDAGA
jgi:hypothetical protein